MKKIINLLIIIYLVTIAISFFSGFYFNEYYKSDITSNISNSCIDNNPLNITNNISNNLSYVSNNSGNISKEVNITLDNSACGDNVCAKGEAIENFCELDCGGLSKEDLNNIAQGKISYSK